ncbi:MAG: RES family NAD+ phosphorylase [Spirosomaceae bacterium]|jgi:RES domain-containing protein|nr:RES family NAD+ phosphorylase [Spirosomataceae bacterium]
MVVYRISNPVFAQLTASGYEARWNFKESYVLYTSQNISLACLENVVHRQEVLLRIPYTLMYVEIPDDMSIKIIDYQDFPNKLIDLEDKSLCQNMGDDWYQSKETCILKVPSIIIPQEFNYIINTKHPDFKQIKLINKEEFWFDRRIKK